MKKFIAKYKILLIVLFVIAVTIGLYFWIFPLNVEGRLVNYTKVDQTYEFEYAYCRPEQLLSDEYADFNMTREEIEDVQNNPDDYDSYFIGYYIHNLSDHMLYDLNAKLDKKYNNLWFETFISDFPINIENNETFDYNRLWLIIKTKDMSDSDIDRLIKNIGIVFSAQNFEYIPLWASTTLNFDNAS
jgi:hypothetical protein